MAEATHAKKPVRRPSLRAEANPVLLMRKKQEAKVLNKLASIDSAQFERLFKDVRNHSDSDTISKDAFRQVMKENGTSIFDDEQILDSFWGALDANKDHTVNKKELIVGLTVLANGSAEEKLKLSFNIYDLDRSGSISVSEFKTMMRAMGRLRLYNEKQLEAWVETTVSELFKKIDKDGSGELSRDEFVQAAKGHPDILDLLTVHVAPNSPKPSESQ
eukprot:TRINITY_DN14095_c0_g1_i1.p1 TRINITY_DN14095_c0_g1~~TRINITY_DN14095_c0_g1_i1.p1  ORF type:complete len:217 (+),score=62.21 TRINITY_DN14095_c0_g1_i1:31-681(+)